MKGYNVQQTQCNFIFFPSQSPLSEYNIHNDDIAAIHFPNKRVLPSREKHLNITSICQIYDLIMNGLDLL
jgi:hypothetical protein